MRTIYLWLAAVIVSNWIFTLYFHFSVDLTAKKKEKKHKSQLKRVVLFKARPT